MNNNAERKQQRNVFTQGMKKYNHATNIKDLPHSILTWLDKNSNDIIGVWNYKGKLQFVTENVAFKLSYDPAELLFDGWCQTILKEDMKRVRGYISTNLIPRPFQVRIFNHAGKSFLFECLLEDVPDEASGDGYYVGLFKDISDKVNEEDLVVKSEKMSIAGQLAAGIAHEIRNPLTSLKGFLQLLQAGVKEKESYYQIMNDEIEKIRMITTELLFISKPLTNNKQNESVSSMLNDVIVLLNSQARLRNIFIKMVDKKEHFIYCDRSQIKQAFINIIKNAIEATEESGKITIELQTTASHIEVHVVDEGPGISEDILHKVEEPFFTTKQSGTGLGLMITKQILEQHQGEMKITKNSEKGSTFKIIFPKTDIE